MRWRRHKSGFYAHTCVFPAVLGSLWKDLQQNISTSEAQSYGEKKNARAMWEIKSASLPRTVNVHVGLRTVQVVLLSHDDVLDIFHGEVVTESVVKQSLQLIHSQFLHVTLGRQKTQTKVWLAKGKKPSVSMSCRSLINSGSTGELIVMINRSYKNIYWAISSKQHIFCSEITRWTN